jgi:acetyltransferase-like isoleucine patch superfamily enzyme|tara:strand:- start:391 stop:1068 length:678 start_codon:yes stop_codon:yes gene_type:complete
MRRKSVVIYENVVIGGKHDLEDFVVLGKRPNNNSKKKMVLKIGNNALLRTGSIIYAGTTIGSNFQSGDHSRIREGNKIGNNVSIGSNSIIESNSKIGNNVRIHSLCFIPEYTTLEDDVWMGPGVTITNVMHPPCPVFRERGHEMELKCVRGPVIRKGAIIGAGVIILPGIEIGENSFVAAGSVVVKDVKPNSVVTGIPAKQTKKIKDLVCDPGIYEKGEIFSWRK